MDREIVSQRSRTVLCVASVQEAKHEDRELKAELMKQGFKDAHITAVRYIHINDTHDLLVAVMAGTTYLNIFLTHYLSAATVGDTLCGSCLNTCEIVTRLKEMYDLVCVEIAAKPKTSKPTMRVLYA